MKRTVPALLIALLMFTGAPLPAMADVGVSVEFSDEEIRIIGAWYENHEPKAGRGGGKSKHKGLPPGIAKNLSRGKPLPPGIAKQQLPDGLVHALHLGVGHGCETATLEAGPDRGRCVGSRPLTAADASGHAFNLGSCCCWGRRGP